VQKRLQEEKNKMEIIIVIVILIALFRVAFGRRRQPARAKGPQRNCPFCLQSIPREAKACFHCAHDVPPVQRGIFGW
jgi:hypothetical protein